MAQSRLDRIGTIFSRVTALIESGAIKPINKPLWYDIYKAFPPKYEPRYDRPASQKPLKQIFYEEDIIRAQFHKDISLLPAINLETKEESHTELFLKLYAKYLQGDSSKTVAYQKTLKEYVSLFKDDNPRLEKVLHKYGSDTKPES
ncbi:mitochondrial ribosomal protein S23 [Nomia melanderi]|uniref:mitochondrial ribosomal protein S23 n=1 Tax=Nomia melanderi TaxID=2448451 RepID=UPI0013046DA6|nr:probable 28S ribosomal protein S23, mitochondrial [Nomia melanderi]